MFYSRLILRKIYTHTLLLVSFLIFSQQEDKVYNIHDHHPQGKVVDDEESPKSLNVKLMPAAFANTLGLEFELPLKNASSIGLNIIGKYGRLDNPKIAKPVDYFETGFRAELAYKYYFAQKTPLGFYIQAFIGYTKLVYDNGNTRPFSLNLRNLDLNGDPRNDLEFKLPKPYTGGIGFGYQTILIKKRIIGNMMMGSQLGFDSANTIFYSLYISPSVGYVF